VPVQIEPAEALAYFTRVTDSKLREYGFRLAAENCELVVTYKRLASRATLELPGLTAQGGYWNEEGFLTVRRGGQAIVEQEVNLTGYSTRLHLLEGLASVLVKSVVRRFKPNESTGR